MSRLRPALFWIFIVVAGICEAAFAYNGLDSGVMRWLLTGLIVLNVCLFALLDRTPPLRKALVYVAAALVWGGIRYAYRWVHAGIGDHDALLAASLSWVDLVLNLVIGVVLLREARRMRDDAKNQ